MSGGDDTFLDVSTFTYGRPRKKKTGKVPVVFGHTKKKTQKYFFFLF
jgi:hypothetical protein